MSKKIYERDLYGCIYRSQIFPESKKYIEDPNFTEELFFKIMYTLILIFEKWMKIKIS